MYAYYVPGIVLTTSCVAAFKRNLQPVPKGEFQKSFGHDHCGNKCAAYQYDWYEDIYLHVKFVRNRPYYLIPFPKVVFWYCLWSVFKEILVMFHFSWRFAVFTYWNMWWGCSIFCVNVKKTLYLFCTYRTFCCFFCF